MGQGLLRTLRCDPIQCEFAMGVVVMPEPCELRQSVLIILIDVMHILLGCSGSRGNHSGGGCDAALEVSQICSTTILMAVPKNSLEGCKFNLQIDRKSGKIAVYVIGTLQNA